MAPANERASSKLSLLAEAADEYIKLECNRRRHKLTLRKRLSFVDQFSVHAPKSRIKERQAQAKHHEFLLLSENKAPLDAIVDYMRDLAELPPAGRQAISLSPMEQNQLQSWAEDMHKLLHEFTPSSSHHRDPIVTVLEKLQFLQDGHMCLVEVAADARTLLERWNRSGVFDSSSSDEEGGGLDEDDNEDAVTTDDGGSSSRTRRDRGPENTYAYQTVRQRAAANVIKRNVMLWARSQQAFCDRVEELRLFGKTTQSLMEELTSRKRSPSNPANDIFAMVKVRRDNLYSQSINFKDLMLYAKHVALFPVDQALRSVEELDHKRFLFETRCAIKLQTIWRKTKKILQSKRMLKMVQELKLKHEQEEQARQQHLLELKARKASEAAMNKHKAAAKSPKKGGRNSLVSPSSSAASSSSPTKLPSSKSSERGAEQHPGSTPPTQLGRVRSPEPALSREELQSRHGLTPTEHGSDSAAQSDRGSSSRKHHRSADGTEKDSDDDGDTRDVEQAWQSFLDSATTAEVDISEDSEALMMTMQPLNEPQDEGAAVATLSQAIDDDWRNWSDGEEGGYIDSDADSDAEGQRRRNKTATPKSRSKPRSRASTSGTVTEGRLVTPRAADSSAVPDPPSDEEGRHISSRRGVRRIGDLLKPSSPVDVDGADVVIRGGLKFKSNQARVSKMVPFADFGAVKDPAPVKIVPIKVGQASARKHLYDLGSARKQLYDLDSEWINKAALLQLFSPLVEDSGIRQPEEEASSVERLASPRVPEQSRSMRTATVNKAVKMEKLKAALMQQGDKLYRYPDQKQEATDEIQALTTHSPLKEGSSEQTEANEQAATAPHLYAGIAIHRGVVMRAKGRAETVACVAPDPSEPTASVSSATAPSASPPKKLRLGSHAEWLRSIGIASAPSKTPQPPRRTKSSSRQEQHRRSVQKAYRRDTKSVDQTNDDSRGEVRAPSTVLPALGGYRREKGRTFIKQTQPGIEAEPQTLLPSVLKKASNQTPPGPVHQRRRTRRSIRRPLIQSALEAVDEPALSTAATVATLDVAEHEEPLAEDDEGSDASEWSEQPESNSSGASELEECGSEQELLSDGTPRVSERKSMQLIGENHDEINEESGEQQVRYDGTSPHGSGAPPITPQEARRLSRKLRHRRKRHHSQSSSPKARAPLSSDTDLTGGSAQPEDPSFLAQEAASGYPASVSPYSRAASRAPPVATSPSRAVYGSRSSVIPPKNQAAFHRLLRQYLGLLQCDSVPMSTSTVPNTIG